MSRYLLLTTEKDVNTPDCYREHIRQHQIVIIWQQCLYKILPRHQDPGARPSYPCRGSTIPLQHTKSLDTPSPHFLPPPGHGCCSLNFITDQQNCSQTYAPPASPSPSSQKGGEMHHNEARFQPDQFPELSPKKSYTGTAKDATP